MAEYGVDIALRVTGEDRLNKVLRVAGQLENRIKAINAIDITAPGSGKLGDNIRKALVPFRDFARESVNTEKRLGSTIARAQALAESFQFLSNNAKIGSADFKNFTIAADNQSRALSKVAIEQENIIRAARGMQSVEERQIQLAQRYTRLLELRRKRQRELNLEEAISRGGPSSPIGGSTSIPGSPAFRSARQREALSNAIIGGAFPLLFGQGIGAAAGGGLGGALGGMAGGQFGFGLSLVGTALGQTFDTLNIAAKESAKNLKDVITNFDAIKSSSLLASSAQERYIQSLIQSGRIVEANTAIQNEIYKKIGSEGVRNFASLDSANSKLSRTLAELGIQIQGFVAGPLAGFLSAVNQGLSTFTAANRAGAAQRSFLESLPAAQRQQYLQRSGQLAGQLGMASPAERDAAIARLNAEFSRFARPQQTAALSPEAQKRLQLEQATTKELQSQASLAQAQLALAGLDISRNREGYVLAAQRVARQEYENKLLEIKNTMLREGFNLERNQAMIRTANLEYSAKLQQIEKQSQDQLRQNTIDILNLNRQQLQVNIESREQYAKVEEFQKGAAAAADYILKNAKDTFAIRLADLNTEEQIAQLNAKTVQQENQLAVIYDTKRAILNNELYLTERLAEKQKIIADYATKRVDIEGTLGVDQARIEGLSKIADLQVAIIRTAGGDPRAAERLALVRQQESDLLGLQGQRLVLLSQIAELSDRQKAGEFLDTEIKRVQYQLDALTIREKDLTTTQQLQKEQLVLNQHVERYGGIYNSVSSGLTQTFDLLVQGTDAWGDSLRNIASNVLRSIASELLKIFVINQAISAISSIFRPKSGISFGTDISQFGSFRANGGPVSAGSPYIVGERGPELFMPRSSGSIYPNDAMGVGGNNVVVNVDASGTNVQGDSNSSRQLGSVIAAAVQSELVKQQRPGGLLSR